MPGPRLTVRVSFLPRVLWVLLNARHEPPTGEMPDTATAVALAATIGSSDAISAYETVVLVDPADIDAAASITVGYRPPGE